MANNLQLSASINGGVFNINFSQTDDNIPLGSLSLNDANKTGTLDIPLEDGKNYLLFYDVKAIEEGCVYQFDVSSPKQAQAHVQLTLHKNTKDFNAIPFHT